MNTAECITTRRSIRKYKPDPVDHSLIDSYHDLKHKQSGILCFGPVDFVFYCR